MAPYIDNVPPSPLGDRHVPISSIPSPEPMVAPAQSTSAPNMTLPSQASREPYLPVHAGPLPSGDNTGVGIGPGPLRHPRPLTAADLHMQLEKEQEAVVNRLQRELSLLRQQSISVASTASSTSAGVADPTDHNANHLLSGASYPIPSRRHRSSSSLSTTSATTNATTTTSGLTGMSGSTVGTTGGVAGSTISGITPARDVFGQYSTYTREALSRHNSITSSRISETSSPLSSSLHQGDHLHAAMPHRPSISSQPGFSQPTTHIALPAISSSSARLSHLPPAVATSRYEEAAYYRSELDVLKRENDNLRRRVKELERSLNEQRQSSSSRSRSDSGQTIINDDDDESVNVGESAGSVGVGGGH